VSISILCARCGAKLRPHQAEGLCTRCLLESGLDAVVERPDNKFSASSPIAVSATGSGFSSTSLEAIRYFGDYELLEEIARGGMGVVYRARQTSLERIVALKMILAGQFASKQIIQRFRGEVTAAALLQHPNIVAIHDVGIHNGQHYFSMDYVEGQNLSQLVGSRSLPPAKAARYVKLVADAIHYAHQQGILHRDLKPSNVLVDASDQPRITDFGLAKRLEGDFGITMTGQMLGSPNFMPPEQASAQRGKMGRHSDVYGLGAILYHLLTARPPFQAGSFESVINQVLNTEPVSPRLLNSSVPPDLETICIKCLEKEPAKRYQSAQELADELERFLRGEPIHARPVTRAERALRWCRRKPAIASLGAATTLLLLAVAIGSPILAFKINRERLRAEELLYYADMHGAESALDDGDLGRARELVQAHWPRAGQVDLRDFEWRLLWRRCRGDDLYSLQGHSNWVNALKFSPDGETLASRSLDNHLKVWDLTTRTERFTLTNVTRLGGFTADGQGFAIGTGDHSVKLCETTTGRTLHSLANAGDLVSLLADGKRVATTAEEFVVKIWDITSGQETFLLPGKGGINLWGPEFGAGMVITPDGKKLAVSNGFKERIAGITLRDLATGKVLNDWLDQREFPLTFLELSPDGKVLAVGDFNGLVRFWNMATGDELRPPLQAHSESVVSAAFSADGQVLATASLDQTIKLWEFATRRELDILKGHDSGVWAATFSADGKRLASGGQDQMVRLWNTARSPVNTNLSGMPDGRTLIWSPDSKLLAGTSQDQRVRLWDAVTLETRAVLPDASDVLTLSDHGKSIVATFADGSVKYCDVTTGKVTREAPKAPSGERTSVLISPDGRTAAITDSTPIIQLWDIASGNINLLTSRTRPATVLAFSHDCHTLISGGLEGVLNIWDVARKQCMASIAAHSARIVSLAISPDGTIAASGSTDGTIKFWNLKTSRWLATLKGHKRPVWVLAFSPDGQTLASGSGDHSVRLWNVSLRREASILRIFIGTNPGVAQEINSLVFSPDGNTLAAVTTRGALKMFRAATLDEVALRPNSAHALPKTAQ
jgi:eukaryotic-like serine/threonine-protein kinase